MNIQAKKARILIVDDIRTNIKVLVQTLRSEYDISVATDGKNALTVVIKDIPDLILLDVEMPGMDGYEVCKILKSHEDTKRIPIIFVTGKDNEEDETKGLELGAVDYITKPIRQPVVRARVRSQIQIRALTHSLESTLAEQRQNNKQMQLAYKFIRKMFGRYMSDEVVKSILDTPDGSQLGGEKKQVTIMMTDLRGFTAMGERMAPEEVISMLNMYLRSMTEIIQEYRGTIIEFLGDGILALFGAPVTEKDDAQRAVACAIKMQLAMPEVNAKNRELGFPTVVMGCGINTGTVIAGNIGSDLRSKYGVVGNAINLAARIESFTIGGQILISESTKHACDTMVRVDDQWSVTAKGVTNTISVYQVGGIDDGPHAIHMPKPEKIILQPIPACPTVRLTLLEGKRADQNVYEGKITAMTPPFAVIATSLLARRLTNLKIELVDENGQSITNQLYGKVMGKDEGVGGLKVNFTSTPPEAEQAFRRWLGSEDNC